jgi:hypothetical protein
MKIEQISLSLFVKRSPLVPEQTLSSRQDIEISHRQQAAKQMRSANPLVRHPKHNVLRKLLGGNL